MRLYLILISLILGILLATTACKKEVINDENKVTVDRTILAVGSLEVVIDTETGCQYVFYTSNGGIYPRMDNEGRQICKNTVDSE